jgi:hypothetical protein
LLLRMKPWLPAKYLKSLVGAQRTRTVDPLIKSQNLFI